MEANNIRLLVNLSGGSGDQLRRGLDAIASSPHRARMVHLDGGDDAAGDPLLEAPPDHLDLGKFWHG